VGWGTKGERRRGSGGSRKRNRVMEMGKEGIRIRRLRSRRVKEGEGTKKIKGRIGEGRRKTWGEESGRREGSVGKVTAQTP